LGDLVRHQPSSLGKKNSSAVNQEDWEAILTFILLGTAPGPDRAALTEDLEAVAKVDGNLTIIVQKRVEGITVCAVPCGWYTSLILS
jgi:hypothetical protein